jgi:outer membrane protein
MTRTGKLLGECRIGWIPVLVFLLIGVRPAASELYFGSGAPSASPETETVTVSMPEILTLSEAVKRGLDGGDLDSVIAAERVNEAAAMVDLSRSPLLPRVDLTAFWENQTINLRAMGIDFPGVPSIVGPFDVYWATAMVTQKVFDRVDWKKLKESRRAMDLERERLKLARTRATETIALFFLEALRREAEVDAILADLRLDSELVELARQERVQGFATGIDVKRAEVRKSLDESRLIEANMNVRNAKRALLRVVGLPLTGEVALSAESASVGLPETSSIEALALAMQARPELVINRMDMEISGIELDAVRAEWWPSVLFSTELDSAGLTVDQMDFTRAFRLEARINAFSGGSTRARSMAAHSRLANARNRLKDLERAVELEVLNALDGVETAEKQLAAAAQALELAGSTLDLARERFKAGLADNLEVTSAQADLAEARKQKVDASYRVETARLRLLAATGQLSQAFPFL